MILENDDAKARSVRVFESVLEIADRGRDHLNAWESIQSWAAADTWLADLTLPFFVLTALAHVEAAAIQAAKLADTHGNSVSVGYLLNVIEGDRKQTSLCNDWPQLKGTVAAGRRLLEEISETTSRIKVKRDRELAHLDRRDLNATNKSQAIEVAELHRVFDAVDEIARTLAGCAPAFANVSRFSIGFGHPPSEWTADLLYFARAGFHNESVPSPNAGSERIRQLDRALRAASSRPHSR
jgi:HEPN superfamily AbiU2-like protein